MKVLVSVSIPRMFSAYGYVANTYTKRDASFRATQYYCLACMTSFSTTWSYKGNMQGFGDSSAFCPQCGTKHVDRSNRYVIRYLGENETAPISMELAVVECKDFVSLKIAARTMRFTELWNVTDAKIEEEFRFNVTSRKTIFKRKVDRRLTDEFELGNPFDRHIFDVSILYFLTSDSAANEEREALSKLLKTLRETLCMRLETRCKHKLKSMYVSCGSEHGRLLFPLFNMAFRMVFLDAPNLPAPYREGRREVEYFWNVHDVDYDNDEFKGLDYFRKQKNYVSALIELYQLPDVRSVRKILQQDFFAFKILQTAKTFTNNIDYLVDSYALLMRLRAFAQEKQEGDSFAGICRFCAAMAPVYGMKNVSQLLQMDLENGAYWYIRDMASMYRRLSKSNRKLLPGIKLGKLHDWLAEKVEEQKKIGFNFEVPEPIRRRLMMQKDSVRFFLPEKSIELSAAGKELHNCVGTYEIRMAENRLQIVFVADDNGKLVACLEVKNNELVQAKLKYNKPVSRDAKINAEVTEWAEKAGIKIKTSDVRTIYLPAVVAAV